MRKKLWTVAKIGLLGATCIGAGAIISNPDLRHHPTQLLFASGRIFRCGFHGGIILLSYAVSFTTIIIERNKRKDP